ncbi:saccharopine dehydrogenase family protein [Nannocystis bainbridge]|uniref:Saccharopine dehydrogenase NADP-binding domain-containing protein n=1 Tax=Nannocystis bainbridge TaxID=2995303 RepID=A0ABT5EC85_9BACT|nr:saccharopine dehydrogenase NADP-binding domain-containing protein [Nannocystis bainbridge]MDC0723043.1 saccharopine dehydrogenase NADP-binding domain-containing protein [Nannocystis bainbridge]
MREWVLYGANGYTGELIARQAASEGLRPILAGRDAPAIRRLAGELGLEARVFALDDPEALRRGLAGAALVLHAAGPFSRTSAPMVAACLESEVHYLDITGEIPVFEACRAQDARARERGVVLMPGVGFDVVPSDCLAKALAEALPEATRLELAILALGELSRGTTKTMIEHLGAGGVVREGGRLVPIAPGSRTRTVRLGGRERLVVAVPWGDLATAYASTGIENITTWMSFPKAQIRGMRALRLLAPLLRLRPVIKVLQALVDRRVTGPDEQVREAGSSEIWGRVEAPDGRAVEGRVRTPEGYKFTVIASLASVRRMLEAAPAAGYQTPATAFGSGFVATLPGCSLTVPETAGA